MNLPNNPPLKKTPGTTDSPYLGSKISLVSKAKIRYEGILYTIDANESTVALSKVRSFGTEDRPTDRPVLPRDEVFEYIIFRGADIEDLQVREPPQSSIAHDPAIVESSLFPANSRSSTTGNSSLGSSSQAGQTRLSANQVTMPSGSTQQGSGKGHKSSSNTDPLNQLNINQQQSSKPYSQQSTAAQPDGQEFSYGGGQRRGRQQPQDHYNEFGGSGGGGGGSNRRANQNYGYAEWPRMTNSAAWDGNWGNGYRQQQRYPRGQQNYEGGNQRFYPQRRFNNVQQANGFYGNDRGHGFRQRRNSTGGITGSDDQNRNQQRNNRQQREGANSTRGNGSNNRSALKFIGDFDFEKANAEFNKDAIEEEIKKSLSIKTVKGETSSDILKSPSKETTKTDTNTQQEKENQQQPPSTSSQTEHDPVPEGYYDKQKSFFDRISCEATEKERTNSRRNWNEERRMNAETFGLKYRPGQQGGNGSHHRGGYYNNNRRNNNGNTNSGTQQMHYGDGGRQARGGGYGGQQQQRGRGNVQGYGRNPMYYSNSNSRMRAY